LANDALLYSKLYCSVTESVREQLAQSHYVATKWLSIQI